MLPLIGSTTNIYSCEKKFADPTTVAMVAYILAAVVPVRNMNKLQESLPGFVAGTFADPNVEAN